MNKPLISIIIPTYNRAHLIHETLDSVLVQTYSNWNCIVVDDGSTDNTEEILESYEKKDARFQYHKRPANRKKGANACRNYGFELSKGKYVNWFDDDDIMLNNFLKLKIIEFQKSPKLDFVVSRGANFNSNGYYKELPISENNNNLLDHNNFILGKVFWTTPDFICKKSSIKNILFDEVLKSGQEFNFFTKILAINNLKGNFINKVLFKRRLHDSSIQTNLTNDTKNYNRFYVYKNTFLETQNYLNNFAKDELFKKMIGCAFAILRHHKSIINFELCNLFVSNKGVWKTFMFLFSLLMQILFKKGYQLMNYSRN